MPMEPNLADKITSGLKGWWLNPYKVEQRNYCLYDILPRIEHLGVKDHYVQHRLNGETKGVFVMKDGSTKEFDSSLEVCKWVAKLQEEYDLKQTRKSA